MTQPGRLLAYRVFAVFLGVLVLACGARASSSQIEPPQSLPDSVALDRFSSDKALGCIVGAADTTFRVFSPRATRIQLVLFDRYDADDGRNVDMTRDEDGVWEATVPGRLYGTYYGYRVAGPTGPQEMFDPNVVIADPYARAVVTRNTWRHPGKTLILDTSYDWQGDTYVVPADHANLIIYETHLRDATAHPSSGVASRGTYRGFVERGKPGGLSYLKRLGVNAVEFLPVFDFGNIELPYKDPSTVEQGYPVNTWNPYERNHWGYMTSSFFAPESYYATNGTLERGQYCGVDGRAVREMKDMVKELHREGVAVILDVVYNHVSQYDYNAFKYLDKFYYFRTDAEGRFLGDSGTGNDFKTERPMARRMIVDSIVYWMTEYHIDGFRFDLGAMIDRETLEDIRDRARKINPNVVLIAEPWGGGKYDPSGFSSLDWAAWNDRIRNGVKGRNPRGPVPPDGPGFIFGAFEGSTKTKDFRSFVLGTLAKDGGLFQRPEHSVNYLESHDDNTMGDYIRFVTGSAAPHERVRNVARNARLTPRQLALNKLAATFLFTVQGPVMIHQGQEYARSKVIARTSAPDPNVGQIDDNSYEKDNETNYIDYSQARRNRNLVDYYRGLIELRTRYPALSHGSKTSVAFADAGSDFTLAWQAADPSATLFVVLNGDPRRTASVPLPPGTWRVLANGKAVNPIRGLGRRSGMVRVPPTSSLILKKEGPP